MLAMGKTHLKGRCMLDVGKTHRNKKAKTLHIIRL